MQMLLQEVLANGRGSLNYCQNLMRNINSQSQSDNETTTTQDPSNTGNLLVQTNEGGASLSETETVRVTLTEPDVSESSEHQTSASLADPNTQQPENQPTAIPEWCKCGNCQNGKSRGKCVLQQKEVQKWV